MTIVTRKTSMNVNKNQPSKNQLKMKKTSMNVDGK